jgi:uroporphyrinogen III methyltransferase / synthase
MAHPGGKVHILGAGPGSALFLTASGQALLSTADVVIYDALIDSTLLSLTPKNCMHLEVGKRGQEPSVAQADINRLLIRHCQQGKQVVRLKSGDPALFGRVASEVLALRAAHCEVAVWPGLSSALAVPVLAGIPLTDPELSGSIAIVSAHAPDSLDWVFLARSESLVVLMGGRSLPTLVEQLQHHGKLGNTPIAIIRWGGWPQQQVWIATLETILSKVKGERLSPTIIVIGPVVNLRETLGLSNFPNGFLLNEFMKPFDLANDSASSSTQRNALPLAGRTILATRSAAQAADFRQGLEAQGATVLEMAALEIVPPSSWDLLDQAISQLSTFDWLILTSTNGVQYCMERLLAQGKDARALAGVKIAVVGRKTAASLKQWGLTPDFIPPNYIADDLVAHFPDPERLKGLRCLFPRVESGGREVLVQELAAQGVDVVEVPAYQSRCPQIADPEILKAIAAQSIDIITFASSKTVDHFWQILKRSPVPSPVPNPVPNSDPTDWLSLLRAVKIASIGPQTSQACTQRFGRVDIEAREYTLEGLTQSIVEAYHPISSEATLA